MAEPAEATGVTAAVNRIERAHQMYREGRHEEALAFYTEALAMARNKAQRIALHSNRAACYLKLHDFKKIMFYLCGEVIKLLTLQADYLGSDWGSQYEAAEECTSVLELDHQHTGALMLRAQTLVTLKEYQSALFDVNRLMELNPSSDVYKNLQARLKTQLSLAPIPESEEETVVLGEGEEEGEEEKPTEDADQKIEQPISIQESTATQTQNNKGSANEQSRGWEAIPKPKGHSGLDYSRWDKVEDDSSEDEEEEDEQPRYRFRVRTVGVRSVK